MAFRQGGGTAAVCAPPKRGDRESPALNEGCLGNMLSPGPVWPGSCAGHLQSDRTPLSTPEEALAV